MCYTAKPFSIGVNPRDVLQGAPVLETVKSSGRHLETVQKTVFKNHQELTSEGCLWSFSCLSVFHQLLFLPIPFSTHPHTCNLHVHKHRNAATYVHAHTCAYWALTGMYTQLEALWVLVQ